MCKKITFLLAAIGFAGLVCAQTELNQATEIELDGLNGLGPAVTRQILAERDKAPFKDWPDAMRRVKGIGPHKAARLSQQGLRVQGAPYPDPQHPASTSPASRSPKKLSD